MDSWTFEVVFVKTLVALASWMTNNMDSRTGTFPLDFKWLGINYINQNFKNSFKNNAEEL